LLWSKNWVGGNDKNLRILHLKLSLLTNHLTLNDSEKYYKYQRDFKELLEYSSAKYESSIRTNAFAALNSIGCTDEVYFKNLVNASTHYSWQFAKFAKEQLRYLLKSAANRKQFETLLAQCNDKEQRQLQRLLEEK